VNSPAAFFLLTMTPLTPPSPAQLLPAALNHLLAQENWARSLLAPHAGKVAVFDAGAVKLRLKVAPDGLLELPAEEESAAVTIRVRLSDLPLILQNRERAFSYVKIEGDADFANTISQVSQSLRWEAEEDLSKIVGDIAATRIVGGAQAAVKSAKSLHRSVTENLAEYFLEENPMLMRPQAVAAFTDDVTRLRDDVARLDKRIERLAATKGGKQ
jgi:ubiquinone biosynthesis protein UbiJ